MRNWINDYGTKTRKFQAGGPMEAPAPEAGGAPAGAPAEGGAPDIEGMLAEYAQSRDPQLAVAICDALIEMLAAQQGGAPAGPEAGGAPMARRGMRTRRAPIFRK